MLVASFLYNLNSSHQQTLFCDSKQCQQDYLQDTPTRIFLHQACTTQKARKVKLININSPRAAKVYFVIVWKKFWKDKYLSKIGLLQHFLQLSSRGPHVARGPYVVQACPTVFLLLFLFFSAKRLSQLSKNHPLCRFQIRIKLLPRDT